MLVGAYLSNSARRSPDKEALVCGSTRLTYNALDQSARSLAAFLADRGLRVGDRVAVLLENSPEAVISIFGVLQAGGCLVALPPSTPADRLGYLLEHSSARFIVASGSAADQLREAERLCTAPPVHVLTGDVPAGTGGVRFDEACRTPAGPPREFIDLDLAAIIYTSGSTGKPKGVTLTHRNVDTVTESVAAYLEHTQDDVILDFLPLSIGYGLLQLLVTSRMGGRLVLEKGFGYPYEMLKRLRDERVTGFAGVPTAFSIFLHLSNIDKEDFSTLRYITNAAAAMPPSFIPRIRTIFPTAKLYLMHGLTECLRTTFLPPEELDRRPTSVGRGMPNVELWIEDQDGNRLSSGQTGELCVRGSNIMQGYWNDPESTNRVLKPGSRPGERILHCGDLFTMDDDGFFYFVSRMDDIIKCSGRKVSPVEVENVIYRCPDVLEVRVIGVPDNILGHAIKAEIVLRRGAMMTANQVRAHCEKHLHDYQVPHIVSFVASLPKSAGGKIKRVA